MNKTPARILDVFRNPKTRRLTAKRWTKGSLAKDKKGVPVPPWSRRAACWCLRGAMLKADAVWWGISIAPRQDGDWNDDPERKFSDIVAFLRKAAKDGK